MEPATTDAAPPAVAAPAFAAGVLIGGRYRLESRLGSGGGGTVWRCTDEKLDAVVALKILSADGDLERWRREVAMARRIADRNVCRVHDLGEADGIRFVTMELVEGVGLRQKIAADLGADEARGLFEQVVSGTAAIHAAGVVHRDLKPDNVVVATDGRAVIVDFGLARPPRTSTEAVAPASRVEIEQAVTIDLRSPSADDSTIVAGASPSGRPISATVTHAGTIVGTPRYMSPEQAAGGDVDARTDVWALGLIGHELLTGTLPDHADDGDRRIDALAKWPRATPVLRKCLAFDASERYADARALRTALLGAARRRRGALIAFAAAVSAAGVAIALLATRDDRPAAIVANTGPVTITPLVKQDATPVSVALAPDATSYAYTTAVGRLFVATIAGGVAREWKLPAVARRAPVSVWVAGWFSDRSLAIVATSEASTWHLVRVYADGRSTELYSSPDRFVAAATGEAAVVGVHGSALYAISANEGGDSAQIATIGRGEVVMAVAISPDASRIAIARLTLHEPETTIQVMSFAGDDVRLVWRGKVANAVDQVLGWLDDDRIVFAQRGTPVTKLYVHDLRTKQTTPRHEWKSTYTMERPPGIVAPGAASAARGRLLVVDTTQYDGVMIGDARGENLRAVAMGGLTAGWTTDMRAVFTQRDGDKIRIVRASSDGVVERWPGLEGVYSSTMFGDSVIVHHADAAEQQLVIERVEADGKRVVLHRLAGTHAPAYLVRCAGDRAAPCFLEDIGSTLATWRAFDPVTGAVGRVLYKRQRQERLAQPIAALSPDGKTLAIVEGTGEVFLVELDSAQIRTLDAGDGVDLNGVAFGPDGSLWASAIGYRGRPYAMVMFPVRDGRIVAEPEAMGSRDQVRFYWRPFPSPDGKHVAVQVKEFQQDVSRIDGL